MIECRCGCGGTVQPPNKAYVNKEHQLKHLGPGGEGRRHMARVPTEVKQRGGRTSGKKAVESGRLAEAGLRGAARAHEIAEMFRQRQT